MIETAYAERRAHAESGAPKFETWVQLFREIGEDLRVRVD
jgi:hypothetical protein